MKHLFSILILFIASVISSVAGNDYKFSVDLTKCLDDKLTIELITPAITTTEAIYKMPKMVPGTYEIYDFGRFVSDFKVFCPLAETEA